jgi:hypothetical protein
VRGSVFGADFPRERFLATPLRTLYRVIQEISDLEQRQANIESITVARLTEVVIQSVHAMSGSRSRNKQKARAKDFLPFPDWKPVSAESEGPSESTKFVLGELIHARRIPMYVYLALLSPYAEGG